MADVVSVAVRSRMMAGIRGKNTKPELIIRQGLHARGFRYVLHDKRLPGKPDLVFPRHRAVIFVHGCFWHGHDCHLFKWPKTRKEFWRSKIERNREIDESAVAALRRSGWRYCIIWECSLKGPTRLPVADIIGRISVWLDSTKRGLAIRGLHVVKGRRSSSRKTRTSPPIGQGNDRRPMTPDSEIVSSSDQGDNDSADLLVSLLEKASNVLVKKLSNNDRDWAKFSNKHQAGVYIPPTQRDGGFFPPLIAKDRPADAAEILETYFTTEWPQVGEARRTRLVHYTSKGAETHMTGLPKEAFAELSPASFLVMARFGEGEQAIYRCLTVDSASDAAVMLVDALELEPDFLIDEREPLKYRERERDRILTFAEEVAGAWLAGTIAIFAAEKTAMPETLVLADQARGVFLRDHARQDLNPFEMETPGDALREISRAIEWELFRNYQLRERAVGLVRIVLGDVPGRPAISTVIRALVDGLPAIDRYMLSAGQQRKARAGVSFEHHIERMLIDGKVPFGKQVVIQARKRPDFVLPSLAHLNKPPKSKNRGLILSAKTTLRERWKQVEREMHGRELFLGTVDENIAANAIEEMASMGINLVVPEMLKKSKETEYERHKNVLSFKTFFGSVIRKRMASW